MIDIHSHILPGIDDGAPDLETAVAMCRLALADGCTTIIATPHQRHDYWPNDDGERLERLRARLQEAVGTAPVIHLGAEIRVDLDLLDEIDRRKPRLTPLAGSRYLLLEYARGALGTGCEELVHEVVVAGWRPILAHPEFIHFLASDPDLMSRLTAAGALFQVTAMSVTGDFGPGPKRLTEAMLRREQVHFVASDCHSVTHRPPGLARARDEIAARHGADVAERLTRDNGHAVVEDRPLVPVASTVS